jgi:hypothetical protein
MYFGSRASARGRSGEIMKSNLIRVAVGCALLMFTSTAATAEQSSGWYGAVDLGIAVASVNVTVKNRADNVVARLQTDAKGEIRTSSLPPGEYQMVVDGPSLVAAVDRIAPAPENKSDGPSVSLGGFLGGSSRSSSGHEGGDHGSRSSGGVGLGITLPLGHDNPPPGDPIIYTPNGIIIIAGLAISGTSFSSVTPYCRDTAAHGMVIGFTIPSGANGDVAVGQFQIKF